MTKLDLVLARLSKLPPERQELIVGQIEFLIENQEGGASLLSDEEWAEIEPTLDEDQEEISHEQVAAEMRAKFAK